jgi:hypothetical protein
MHVEFTAKVWEYPGPNPWVFISVPEDLSQEIKKLFGHLAAGFGSLKVTVKVGKTEWQTSIFPDSKTNCYMLPLKKLVRKSENLIVGEETSVMLALN